MERALRSFTYFIKELNILFGFISHTNIANRAKKELNKNVPFFLKNVSFFFRYIFIYICLYISIYIYIYMYIEKRMERSCVLLQKNEMFSRSFPFFAKERCVLCVLFCSLQKNGIERNVLLGLISRQKLEKRMEKNRTFFFRTE